MNEVTSLLRTMRMESHSNPQMRALRQNEAGGSKSVLLDGGATHCLRVAKSRAEWENGAPCEVSLWKGMDENEPEHWNSVDTGSSNTVDHPDQRTREARHPCGLGKGHGEDDQG